MCKTGGIRWKLNVPLKQPISITWGMWCITPFSWIQDGSASSTLASWVDTHVIMQCWAAFSVCTSFSKVHLPKHTTCAQFLVSGSASGIAQTKANWFSSNLKQPLKLFITFKHFADENKHSKTVCGRQCLVNSRVRISVPNPQNHVAFNGILLRSVLCLAGSLLCPDHWHFYHPDWVCVCVCGGGYCIFLLKKKKEKIELLIGKLNIKVSDFISFWTPRNLSFECGQENKLVWHGMP